MKDYSYAEEIVSPALTGFIAVCDLLLTSGPRGIPAHHGTDYNSVLVRHGSEIGVKAKPTRNRMVAALNKTILEKTKALGVHKVEHIQTRTIVQGGDPVQIAQFISNFISGTNSTSPMIHFCLADPKSESILAVAVPYALKYLKSGTSFGFKVRRTGNHDFTSTDLGRVLGDRVMEKAEEDGTTELRIDLTDPLVLFHVEIKSKHVFLYHLVFAGIDGLPAGSQGYVYASIRPWIPDYLSACLMQRRGVSIVPVYFETGAAKAVRDAQNYLDTFLIETVEEKGIRIPLEEIFISNWKMRISPGNLCLACHVFTENLLMEACSTSHDQRGFVSGISLSDYPPRSHQYLNQNVKALHFRPLLLPNSPTPITPFTNILGSIPKATSCCKVQERRESPSDHDEVDVHRQEIIAEARSMAQRFFPLKKEKGSGDAD